MGKIDWQGISTAIGQVNQLIKPSAAQQKELDFQDWKTKQLWSQGFEQTYALQTEIDKNWQEFESTTEDLAAIDATLATKIDDKDKTPGALKLHELLGAKTLEDLMKFNETKSQELAETRNILNNETGKIVSYNSGEELLGKIPLTYDENSQLPEHLKGLVTKVNEDGTPAEYGDFDSDGDGRLSTSEYKTAKTQVINMLAGRDDLAYTFNPEAFEVGFNNALDEEKTNEAVIDAKNAEKILEGKLAKQKIDYDSAALTLQEKQAKYNKSQESIENMKIDAVIEEIDFLESDFLFDATNPDIAGRKYFHGKIEKEMAAGPQYARTMESQERLRKLYARAMELDVDSESIGLPTLQKLSQISGHGDIRDVWGDLEEVFVLDYSGGTIGPEDYQRIMKPVYFEGETEKPYTQRRDAVLEIVRNPNLTKDQIDKILTVADKSPEELKTVDNEGVPIDKTTFGKEYMSMLKALTDNVDNETEFNRIYENLLMFFK